MPTSQANGHTTNDSPDPRAGRGERNLTIIDWIEGAVRLRTIISDASTRLPGPLPGSRNTAGGSALSRPPCSPFSSSSSAEVLCQIAL